MQITLGGTHPRDEGAGVCIPQRPSCSKAAPGVGLGALTSAVCSQPAHSPGWRAELLHCVHVTSGVGRAMTCCRASITGSLFTHLVWQAATIFWTSTWLAVLWSEQRAAWNGRNNQAPTMQSGCKYKYAIIPNDMCTWEHQKATSQDFASVTHGLWKLGHMNLLETSVFPSIKWA